MLVVPAPSAFSLASARLGWSLPHTALLSAHGRNLDLIQPHLQPGTRLLVLTSGGDGPTALAQLLTSLGFGASRLTLLEALGGPRERVQATTAAEFRFGTVDALNTVAIEVEAAPDARIIARSSGLADHLFEHDGQITKREMRAVTLSSLGPRRGELLRAPLEADAVSLRRLVRLGVERDGRPDAMDADLELRRVDADHVEDAAAIRLRQRLDLLAVEPEDDLLDLDAADALVISRGATRLAEFDDHRVYADIVGHPFCLYPVEGAAPELWRLVIDARDPDALREFYEGLLGTDTTPTLEGESWLMHHGFTQAEGVANLDKVPPTGCLVDIGYPKFKGGLGGYARYIAICPPGTKGGVGISGDDAPMPKPGGTLHWDTKLGYRVR